MLKLVIKNDEFVLNLDVISNDNFVILKCITAVSLSFTLQSMLIKSLKLSSKLLEL